MRTELRGHSCLPLELVQPQKKSICCSRSFAGAVTTESEMVESLINYLSTAAEKLRKGRLVASAITVFIETSQFRENHLYSNSGTAKVLPTDSTRELLATTLRILRAIYKPGYKYRKSGVILLGLQPVEGQTQRLFGDDLYIQDRELMKVIDTLNARYGKQTIRFGMPAKTHTQWKMNREYLSPAYNHRH